MKVPLTIQHRHVHLSRTDLRRLFGDESQLHKEILLKQKGQFVFKETVSVIGTRGELTLVKVLGPTRTKTQVELSASDAAAIGVRAPLRHSGDLSRAGSCKLKGPKGSLRAVTSIIVSARHVHCDPKSAKRLKIKNYDIVCLQHINRDDVRLEHVLVRVHPTFSLELHLNQDEAAELWLQSGEFFELC